MFTFVTILMLLALFTFWKMFKVVHMREAAIKEKFDKMTSAVFLDFKGLNVEAVSKLRDEFRLNPTIPPQRLYLAEEWIFLRFQSLQTLHDRCQRLLIKPAPRLSYMN